MATIQIEVQDKYLDLAMSHIACSVDDSDVIDRTHKSVVKVKEAKEPIVLTEEDFDATQKQFFLGIAFIVIGKLIE